MCHFYEQWFSRAAKSWKSQNKSYVPLLCILAPLRRSKCQKLFVVPGSSKMRKSPHEAFVCLVWNTFFFRWFYFCKFLQHDKWVQVTRGWLRVDVWSLDVWSLGLFAQSFLSSLRPGPGISWSWLAVIPAVKETTGEFLCVCTFFFNEDCVCGSLPSQELLR